MHQGSYLSDTLFYPEPHIPVERVPQGDGLDPLRPALQPAPGGGDQEGGHDPGHDGVRIRRRIGRPGHRRGQDRLRRLQPPHLRRRRVSRQDAHRPGPRGPALHQVRALQQHIQRPQALPHQRLLWHRVLRPDPTRDQEEGPGHRRRSGRHAGGPGGGDGAATTSACGRRASTSAAPCRSRRWSKASRSRTCARSSGSCGGRSRNTAWTSSWAKRSTRPPSKRPSPTW